MRVAIVVGDSVLHLSGEVGEYLELVQKALALPSLAEVVGKIVVDSYSDDIRKHPEVRPETIKRQIAELEDKAKAVFESSVSAGIVKAE